MKPDLLDRWLALLAAQPPVTKGTELQMITPKLDLVQLGRVRDLADRHGVSVTGLVRHALDLLIVALDDPQLAALPGLAPRAERNPRLPQGRGTMAGRRRATIPAQTLQPNQSVTDQRRAVASRVTDDLALDDDLDLAPALPGDLDL